MNTVFKKTHIASFSLGFVCACSVHAQVLEQSEADASRSESRAEPGIVEQAYYRSVQGIDRTRRKNADLQSLGWQFDVGLPEDLHKVVASWPSIHWISGDNREASMASLGYTWRTFKLEGALFKERESNRPIDFEATKLDLIKRLFSYSFAPNWSLQFSRGYRNSPDHLGQEVVRRTTASTTYRTNVGGNPWHVTLAWGRGKESAGSSKNTYLLESAMRIDRQHTIFGRFERAGNDELFRNEPASHQRSYDARKFTVGYLYDVTTSGPALLSIGGLASRREVPAELLSYYGNDTSYMVFMRMHVKFAAN